MAEIFRTCPACDKPHGIPVGQSKPPGATSVICRCGAPIFHYAPEPERDSGGSWTKLSRAAG